MFERLIEALTPIANEIPLVFPVHPRTRARVADSPSAARLVERGSLRLLDPLGYLEFIGLLDGSRVTLTDSGGIQEETTILGIPCMTLRENTERPITVTSGTNVIVGTDPARIMAAWQRIKTEPVTSCQAAAMGWSDCGSNCQHPEDCPREPLTEFVRAIRTSDSPDSCRSKCPMRIPCKRKCRWLRSNC